tara:strand:- start:2499 stop:3560 length:1062 start_codon:yes stop_codon:yes gene_type:complete
MDILKKATLKLTNEEKGSKNKKKETSNQDGAGKGRYINASYCGSREDVLEDDNECSFVIQEKIGAGAFGTVFRCIYRNDESTYCVKEVKVDPEQFNREISILQKINNRSQHIIRCIDTYVEKTDTGTFYYIIMPIFQQSLASYIKQISRIPSLHIFDITKQIMKGLHFLHNEGIMHRDIKPDNILISEFNHTKKGRYRNVVICDMGSAKEFRSHPHTAYITTRYYRAPELVLDSSYYTNAIDMWSLGCIIVEMHSKTPLFHGIDNVEILCEILQKIGLPSKQEFVELNMNLEEKTLDMIMNKRSNYVSNKVENIRAHCHPRQIKSELMVYIINCLHFSPRNRIQFMCSVMDES